MAEGRRRRAAAAAAAEANGRLERADRPAPGAVHPMKIDHNNKKPNLT